jgi:hypothetical protein
LLRCFLQRPCVCTLCSLERSTIRGQGACRIILVVLVRLVQPGWTHTQRSHPLHCTATVLGCDYFGGAAWMHTHSPYIPTVLAAEAAGVQPHTTFTPFPATVLEAESLCDCVGGTAFECADLRRVQLLPDCWCIHSLLSPPLTFFFHVWYIVGLNVSVQSTSTSDALGRHHAHVTCT